MVTRGDVVLYASDVDVENIPEKVNITVFEASLRKLGELEPELFFS